MRIPQPFQDILDKRAAKGALRTLLTGSVKIGDKIYVTPHATTDPQQDFCIGTLAGFENDTLSLEGAVQIDLGNHTLRVQGSRKFKSDGTMMVMPYSLGGRDYLEKDFDLQNAVWDYQFERKKEIISGMQPEDGLSLILLGEIPEYISGKFISTRGGTIVFKPILASLPPGGKHTLSDKYIFQASMTKSLRDPNVLPFTDTLMSTYFALSPRWDYLRRAN